MLAVPVALLVAMFSLQEVPQPLKPSLSPDAFDGEAATTLAQDLAEAHPSPVPGSESDAALADVVQQRFTAIPGAELAEQRFEASYDGEDVELRNVIMSLPGRSERQVALIAGRDGIGGPGAGSGIASTAALLEIAAALAGSTHEKTIVIVSSDGASIGALGARRFVRDYSEASLIDAAIVISQPAAQSPERPFVVPWSAGAQSTGIQLERTANQIVSDEADRPAGDEDPLSDLFRLAIPANLGEQGPLIESGLDSVRLSSAGELPLPATADGADGVSGDTLDRFGRSALALALALDAAPSPTEHGPDAYVGLAGNLLPGWTLALLALAFLAPVAIVAGGGLAVSAGRPTQAARALGWAALRAVPLLLGAASVYAFATIGLIPSPDFPFDPAAEDLGLGGRIGVSIAVLITVGVAFLLRPLLPPARTLARVAPPAALCLAVAASFLIWLVNPYIGLLVAVGLQALVPAAAGVVAGRLRAAGIAALGLLPALAALVDLAGRFDAGPGVIWDLLFLFTGEQLSDTVVLLGCLLAGATLAVIAANGEAPDDQDAQLKLDALVERGRRLEERRAAGREKKQRKRARRERRRAREEGDAEAVPEPPAEDPAGEESGEAEEPAQPDREPEPDRDPRMWSKPDASTARPWASVIVTPAPSVSPSIT